MSITSYKILVPTTLFVGIFILPNQMFSQEDSLGFQLLKELTVLQEEGQYTVANQLALQAIDVFKEKEDWDNWGRCYDELYWNARGIDTNQGRKEALKQLETAYDFIQKDASIFSPFVKSRIIGNIAFLHHDMGAYAAAHPFYRTALIHGEQKGEDYFLLRLYTNFGTALWASGDDFGAIRYQEKARSIVKKFDNLRAHVYVLTKLATAYQYPNPSKSIETFKEVLLLSPKNPEAYMSLSKVYEQLGNISEALKMAESAWDYAQHEGEKSDALHQLGRVYFAMKDYDKSIDYYKRALPFAAIGYGKSNPEYAKIHQFIGSAYLKKGNYQKALQAYNETLNHLLPLFSPNSAEDDPAESELTNRSLWVVESLQGKSQTYSARFNQTQRQEDYQKALLLAEMGVHYLQKIKSRFGEDESKFALNDSYFSACEFAMETAFNLAHLSNESTFLERAFAISNQNKAVVLNEGLYRKEVKHLANIPDSLLNLEKEGHRAIVRFEKLILEAENDEVLRLMKDSLFQAKRDLEIFEQHLETNFPIYADAKFTARQPKRIEQIRTELPENAALIEYFLGDSSVYTFLISRDTFWAEEQSLLSDFDESLDIFLRSVSDWGYVQDSSKQATQDYLKTADYLYQTLLKKPLDLASEERIIIVPDGALGLVPFELFLTHAYDGNWTDREVPFLIKERAISYRYSANLGAPKPQSQSTEWGGFGSEFKDLNPKDLEDIQIGQTLLALRNGGELPFADDEIRAIASFLGGKTWLNENATRDNFLQHAEDYGILHLATHGIIDRQNPLRSRLLFSKSIIDEDAAVYAQEIYGMQLKAGLTVLSACNTGTGVWKRGEGIMSLARAFSFAGCPSVVMSLWNISDQSTATLMTDFYQNLKEEQPKDIALQNAKLKYLQTASAEYTKPVYWAGFVGVGDMEALPTSKQLDWFYLGLWVLGLGLMAFFIWRFLATRS